MGYHILTVGIALIAAFGLLYLIPTIWAVRLRVKQMDRANYFLCDRHGAIHESDMLTLGDWEDGKPLPPTCPLCYTERIKHAKLQLDHYVSTHPKA